MSTLWTAASVTATNGSNLITVQSGEDIAAIRTNSWIMVGSAHIMEIKRTFVTDSGVKTIELFDNWEFGPASGQRATVAPSLGEFKTLADDVRRLIQIGEEQINTASVTPEPGSSAKRSENGTVKTAAPQDDDDAVRLQDFTPVKQKGESNEQAMALNTQSLKRRKIKAKAINDATLWLNFVTNQGIKTNELSKGYRQATDLITQSSPDGASGINAAGKIISIEPNIPAITYDGKGRCEGLLNGPQLTNLVSNSHNYDSSSWDKSALSILPNQADSPFGLGQADKLVESADSANHYLREFFSTSVGERYTASYWVAGAEREQVRVFTNLDGNTSTYIDLTDGSVSSGVTPYQVTKLAFGFYRIDIVGIASETQSQMVIYPAQNNNSNYQGDGVSGIYLAATQFNEGYPQPYQATDGTQISRGEVSSIVSEVMKNSEQGTLYFKGRVKTKDDVVGLMAIVPPGGGGSGNSISILYRNAGSIQGYFYSDTGTETATAQDAHQNTGNDYVVVCVTYNFTEKIANVFANGKTGSSTINEPSNWRNTEHGVVFGKTNDFDDPSSHITVEEVFFVPYMFDQESAEILANEVINE